MSSSLLKPHLLLISLTSKANESAQTSLALDEVRQWWQGESEGVAVQLGAEWDIKLLLEEEIPTRKVPIVHIDCSKVKGRDFYLEGSSQVPSHIFAKRLAALPGLQLVILSDVNDNETVRVFLENKVPLVLAFNSHVLQTGHLEHFYKLILKGISLQKAFIELNEEQKASLLYQEISIDPIQKSLKWDERKSGKDPNWTEGLTIRRLDKHRLIWRLKNPEFIKKDAYGLKSLSETPEDLSIYAPDRIEETLVKSESKKEMVPPKSEPRQEEQPKPMNREVPKKLFPDKKVEPLENKAPITPKPETEKKEVKDESIEEPPLPKPPLKPRLTQLPKEEARPINKAFEEKEKPADKPVEQKPVEEKKVVEEKKPTPNGLNHKVEGPKENKPVEEKRVRPRLKNRESKFDDLITTGKMDPRSKETNVPKPVKEAPAQEKSTEKEIFGAKPKTSKPKVNKTKEESPLLSFNKAVERKSPSRTHAVLTKEQQTTPKAKVKPESQEKPTSQEPLKKKNGTEPQARTRPTTRVNKEKAKPVDNPVKGPKHKRRVRRMFILGFVGIIIASVGGWYALQNNSKAGVAGMVPRCPFPSDEGEYRILVAPFHRENNCAVKKDELATQVIQTIQRIKKKDDLRIAVRYQPDLCLERTEDMKNIAGNCHADLVLGGAWRQGVSEGETHLQMFYVLAEGAEEEVLVEGKGIRTEIHGTETLPASSILLEDVKNFVYWASAMRAMKRGYYDDAVVALEKIEASRPELQSLIVLMMTKSLVKGGHYQQALAYFDQLIDEEPQNEKYYLERGVIHSKMGWPQKALDDFDVVLSLSPENTQAPIYRSQVLSKMGNYDAALKDIESLISRYGQLAELYMTRAKIFQGKGQLREAQLDYEKAISLDPNSANAYMGRANILKAKGDIDGAKDAVNQALSHEASHPEANLFNARLLYEQGRISEALEEVEIVISRYPTTQAYFFRGKLNEELGQDKPAIKDYIASTKGDASNIDAWIAQGRIYLDQGKTQKALNAYQRAIDLRSGDADLFCLRGEVYTELKRYIEAQADYAEALKVSPNFARAYYGRALAFLEQKKYQEALKDVKMAIDINPKDPKALIARGRIYSEQENNDLSFKDFESAIKLSPDLSEAYYFRGIAYMKAGEPQKAEDDLDKAVSLGGAQLDAYLFLGDAALAADDPQTALDRFNQAVDYAPESPEPYRHRAEYYLYQSDLTKALQDFNKLIDLQGEATAEDYLKRGKLYLLTDSRTQAMIDYNQAILLAPKWTEAYCTRGDLFKKMGRPQKALEDYNKGVESDPQSPLPYIKKASLFMTIDDEAQAFESVEQAISLSPNFADAYNQRGELYILMEMPAKGMADFQKALELDPTNSNVYTNLGNEAQKLGQIQKAFGYYSQAIRFNPRQAVALYQRGFLKYLEKNYSSAIRDLEASIKANPQNGLAYGTMAKIYAAKREEDKMFFYLELALQHKYPSIELSFEPVFKSYADNARMKDLIARYP